MSLAPETLWAQRNDVIYLTFQVPDLKDLDLKVEDKKIFFKGTSNENGKTYEATLDFLSGRNLALILPKKKKDAGYWPRLLQDKAKPHWLKTDFAKWKDEDEEDEDEGAGMGNDFGGMDFSSIMQQGGMGGMGGMGGLAGLGGAGGMPDLGNLEGLDDDGEEEEEEEEEEEGEGEGEENKEENKEEEMPPLEKGGP